MTNISVRKLAILALLAAPDSRGRAAQPIFGITRLQKLLFLLFQGLSPISAERELRVDFAYEPEKFGPADLQLYGDLEFLESLGHISKSPPKDDLLNPSDRLEPYAEDFEEAALSFDYLMGDEEEAGDLAIAEEVGEQYQITERGLRSLGRILESLDARSSRVGSKVVEEASRVRRQFADWPLQRLLRYVYTTYPEMTTKSRIRERVLRPY